MYLLWRLWLTTSNLSYRFPILKLPPPPCAVLLVYLMRLVIPLRTRNLFASIQSIVLSKKDSSVQILCILGHVNSKVSCVQWSLNAVPEGNFCWCCAVLVERQQLIWLERNVNCPPTHNVDVSVHLAPASLTLFPRPLLALRQGLQPSTSKKLTMWGNMWRHSENYLVDSLLSYTLKFPVMAKNMHLCACQQ